MKCQEFFDEVKRRLQLGTESQVAEYLGIKQARISQLKGKELTPKQSVSFFRSAVDAGVARAERSAIRPIVEFFPVTTVESKQGARFELFPADKENNPLHRGLRDALDAAKGIYVFYDTSGRAVYVGKTEKKSLWSEMNNAFNRDRETQTVYRVAHPTRNQSFKTAVDHPRQPTKTQIRLSDIAAYFSAYEISPGMIGNLEALLVRSFANDVLNVRMEKFVGEAAAKKIRKKATP